VGDWSYVLYPANPEPVTGEHSDGSLSARSRGPSKVTALRPHTNMQRGYAFVLCDLGRCGSSLHRRVRCTLESVGLDMLASCAPGDCLSPREVCDMDHSIVERGENVSYAPSVLGLGLLRHGRVSRVRASARIREFKPFKCSVLVLFGRSSR
jgi:hypothetical protein